MEDIQDDIPVSKEDRTWAMLCHLSAMAGFIMPFGSILGPLIVWLIKKDDMPIVDVHGKKALNFQLTIVIAYLVSLVLAFVVVGLVLLPIIAIFSFVTVIIASIKANEGKAYNYPLSLNFIK